MNIHLTVSQLSRGQRRALGQHLPSGVGGMSPPGQSSVRHPMAEQGRGDREALTRRLVNTWPMTRIIVRRINNGFTQITNFCV